MWREVLAEELAQQRGRRVDVAASRLSVLGFVAVGPSRAEDVTEQIGEIYAIYVDPEHWSVGIGR